MKSESLPNALSTARQQARELERKARDLGLAASNAKNEARQAKSKAKMAKQKAKKARKLAKAAKRAFAEASNQFEKAAAEVRALENKVQEQQCRPKSGHSPSARMTSAASRKSRAAQAPTLPSSSPERTSSLRAHEAQAIPGARQPPPAIPSTNGPVDMTPTSVTAKKPGDGAGI
jgi:hypothetical protein